MTAAIAPSAPIRAFPERRNDAPPPPHFPPRRPRPAFPGRGGMPPPALLFPAPASGTGKTTVTLGLARAFTRMGLVVQPLKSGPDYIDPAFHTAAARRPSVNIDSWAMEAEMIRALTARASDADLVLAEGSMGLFDGVAQAGEHGTGASADIAALMGWPVVLVLDVSGQAQ